MISVKVIYDEELMKTDNVDEIPVVYRFDDGKEYVKKVCLSGIINSQSKRRNILAKSYQLARLYKESIRDWLYDIHGDQYRYKEAIYRNLFRLTFG